jgi:hypothetical protein
VGTDVDVGVGTGVDVGVGTGVDVGVGTGVDVGVGTGVDVGVGTGVDVGVDSEEVADDDTARGSPGTLLPPPQDTSDSIETTVTTRNVMEKTFRNIINI